MFELNLKPNFEHVKIERFYQITVHASHILFNCIYLKGLTYGKPQKIRLPK
jgi:hypothetical protein